MSMRNRKKRMKSKIKRTSMIRKKSRSSKKSGGEKRGERSKTRFKPDKCVQD